MPAISTTVQRDCVRADAAREVAVLVILSHAVAQYLYGADSDLGPAVQEVAGRVACSSPSEHVEPATGTYQEPRKRQRQCTRSVVCAVSASRDMHPRSLRLLTSRVVAHRLHCIIEDEAGRVEERPRGRTLQG